MTHDRIGRLVGFWFDAEPSAHGLRHLRAPGYVILFYFLKKRNNQVSSFCIAVAINATHGPSFGRSYWGEKGRKKASQFEELVA